MDHRAFFPAVLSIAILACDDDGSTASDNDGGSGGASSATSTVTSTASGTTSASTATAGSTSSSGASTGAGGAPIVGTKTGLVGVFSGPTSQSDVGYSVSAGFVERPDATPGVYVESTEGPCVVRVYSALETFGPKVAESAGNVMIDGGSVGVMLSPDAMNHYAKQESTTTNLHAGGDAITVTATGATIPAFTRTLTAPSYIDVTSPAQPADGDPLPIDRTKDLVFGWDGGGAGDLVVLLGDATTSMTCKLPTAPGTGAIPAAALAKLAPSSSGFFLMQAASRTDVVVDDWTVQVIVASSLTWNGVADSQSFSYQASN